MGEQVYVKIKKADRKLQVWQGKTKLAEYNIGIGFTPKGSKLLDNDGKTPEGTYFICTRNEKSRFTLFLGLNYPNKKDAKEGLQKEYITQAEHDLICDAQDQSKRPTWETNMGGEIGIHGKGSDFDWTGGSIALNDEDIKKLWEMTDYQTKVIIEP